MKTNQHSPVIMPHFSWSVRSPANAQKIQLGVAAWEPGWHPRGRLGSAGWHSPMTHPGPQEVEARGGSGQTSAHCPFDQKQMLGSPGRVANNFCQQCDS